MLLFPDACLLLFPDACAKQVFHSSYLQPPHSLEWFMQVLIAEAWMPSYAKAQVQDVLSRTGLDSHTQLSAVMHTLPTHERPPTHFRTNKFTDGPHTVIAAYGVARYREVGYGAELLRFTYGEIELCVWN
jgi:vacuolar-type H+-ATPase subunit I/STV1